MANWYVDKDAPGAGTGEDWDRACRYFGAIPWGNVRPGDKIYISGGIDQQVYTETLKPAAGGADGAFVGIEPGSNAPDPSGHQGQVIIDGQGLLKQGILCESTASYLRINGQDTQGNYKWLIRNIAPRPWRDLPTTNNNACIRCYNGHHLYIDGMDIDHPECFGITFDNNSSSRMKGNRVRTGDVTNQYMVNGLYAQYGTDVVVENNDVIQGAHQVAPLYGEALQLVDTTNTKIRSNHFEWAKDAGNNGCAVVILQSLNGDTYIYNNVMVGNNTEKYQVLQFSSHTPGGLLYILNNTLVSREPTLGNLIHFQNMPDSLFGAIKNNIYISPNGLMLDFDGYAPTTPGKYDYSCYFSGGPTAINAPWSSPNKNWAGWQALGFDTHGINADPMLDKTYRPSPDSPCIGAGANLSQFFATDKDGSPRPAGGPWTLGAYEYPAAGMQEQIDGLEARVAALEAFAARIKDAIGKP